MTRNSNSTAIPRPANGMRVLLERTGTPVVTSLEVADTFWSRARGLMGRAELPEGGGLWISPCRDIHTFFMRFPIDVLYLNRDGGVEKIVADLRPWRVSYCGSATAVLELPAGTAEACGLTVGDHLRFEPGNDST